MGKFIWKSDVFCAFYAYIHRYFLRSNNQVAARRHPMPVKADDYGSSSWVIYA
jgi:hypothetical protein